MHLEGKNVVLDKSLEFAFDIVLFVERLRDERHYVLANQLFKSGTSIGANVHEAQSAESRADFVHKMKIADKEAQETKYWLMLCDGSEVLPSSGELKVKLEELCRLIGKIISSTLKNR